MVRGEGWLRKCLLLALELGPRGMNHLLLLDEMTSEFGVRPQKPRGSQGSRCRVPRSQGFKLLLWGYTGLGWGQQKAREAFDINLLENDYFWGPKSSV